MAKGDMRVLGRRRPRVVPPRTSSLRQTDDVTGLLIPYGQWVTQNGLLKNARDRGSVDNPPFEGVIPVPEVADPD